MTSERTHRDAGEGGRSTTRIGAAAGLCTLVVLGLIAATPESFTAVIAATWEASAVLGDSR